MGDYRFEIKIDTLFVGGCTHEEEYTIRDRLVDVLKKELRQIEGDCCLDVEPYIPEVEFGHITVNLKSK